MCVLCVHLSDASQWCGDRRTDTHPGAAISSICFEPRCVHGGIYVLKSGEIGLGAGARERWWCAPLHEGCCGHGVRACCGSDGGRWLRCWHALYTCTDRVCASVDDPWRAGVGSEWGVSSGDTRGVAVVRMCGLWWGVCVRWQVERCRVRPEKATICKQREISAGWLQ